MNDRQELEARIIDLEAAQLSSRRRMRRLTGVNSLLAVVVLAFGGATAAYAVTLAPANSVNSAAIIDRTIGTPDVKVGAFAGQTILDNSMTTLDVNESTLILTCPSVAPTRVGDVCATDLRTAARSYEAVDDCKDEHLRIPSAGEALMLSAGLNSSTPIWTDGRYWDGSAVMGVTATKTSVATQVNANTASIAYRCVTTVGARP